MGRERETFIINLTTMKYDDFHDYLQYVFADDYMGNGDDMGEACDEWISDLDNEEIMDYADKYGRLKESEGFERARKIALDSFNKPL